MRVVNLSCNECGAPLVVPKSTNYVTCEFCGTQLHVVREGGAAYTEVQELSERTSQLEQDVARLKANDALERLDAEWQEEMQQYLVRSRRGEANIPTKGGAVFAVVAAGIFFLFWMRFAIRIAGRAPGGASAAMLIIGAMIVLGILGKGVSTFKKAGLYERRRAEYERRRREIVASIRGAE